jgi:hypothetical protein
MGPDGFRKQDLLCWRGPAAIYSIGLNKNLIASPDRIRNQEQLYWRGPAAIYCYAVQGPSEDLPRDLTDFGQETPQIDNRVN